MSIEDIIASVRARRAEGIARPIFVMVAGGSATGKSSQVLPQLLHAFGDDALLIEQDWYQLGSDFTEKDSTPYRWDDPRNFQIDRLANDLRELRAGRSVITPAFDVIAVKSVGEQTLSPKPIVIVDGIYTLLDGLHEVADYGIYITMPLYGRFLRRLFRSRYDHGIEDLNVPFKQALGSVLRAHQDIVRGQADRADCVVTMPYNFTTTIERYDLKPQDTPVPKQATKIFSHDGLEFAIQNEQAHLHMYISYNAKLYYDFLVDAKYKALLDGIDFLAI